MDDRQWHSFLQVQPIFFNHTLFSQQQQGLPDDPIESSSEDNLVTVVQASAKPPTHMPPTLPPRASKKPKRYHSSHHEVITIDPDPVIILDDDEPNHRVYFFCLWEVQTQTCSLTTRKDAQKQLKTRLELETHKIANAQKHSYKRSEILTTQNIHKTLL